MSSAVNDRYGRDDTLMTAPDNGHRLRTPEFYRGRAKAVRQIAADTKAQAMTYDAAAVILRKRADGYIDQADLMDRWADETEAAQAHSEGGQA